MSDFLEYMKAEIADLERQLAADRRYMKLASLKQVLEMYEAPAHGSRRRSASSSGSRPFASGVSVDILKVARELLAGRTEPTSTQAIMQALSDHGVHVGGTVPQNSVSSILSKATDFVSHGRSGWTLAVPNGHDKEKAGDERFEEAASPTLLDRRPDQPVEPAQGREAVPGGGT